MAVAQAEHPAVILVVFATLDFHEAEVAHAVVGEAVGLRADGQTVATNGAFHLLHQFDVRDRTPAFCGMRGGDGDDFLPFSGTSTAVEDEVGMGSLNERGGFEFKMSNHRDSYFRCLRMKQGGPGHLVDAPGPCLVMVGCC